MCIIYMHKLSDFFALDRVLSGFRILGQVSVRYTQDPHLDPNSFGSEMRIKIQKLGFEKL